LSNFGGVFASLNPYPDPLFLIGNAVGNRKCVEKGKGLVNIVLGLVDGVKGLEDAEQALLLDPNYVKVSVRRRKEIDQR